MVFKHNVLRDFLTNWHLFSLHPSNSNLDNVDASQLLAAGHSAEDVQQLIAYVQFFREELHKYAS